MIDDCYAGRRFGATIAARAVLAASALLAATAVAASGAGASATPAPAAPTTAAAPNCGSDPVELRAFFETGFDLPYELADEFTQQHPNVTWDISQDQFTNLMNASPRLLSGDNPPDLIRLPSMVSLANDGLLLNLDDHAAAFGWDGWPPAQLAQNRVAEDGTRGSGSLYAMGLNYSLTGVFYNRQLAAEIGMTDPPATVAEFDALLEAAQDADVLPIMAWNASASGAGLAFPLQQLMAAYGPPQPINDWIFQQPDATIDTPENQRAAEHLQGWIEAGYFPEDVNAVQYTDANARFRDGEGLFIFNGDWENAAYDEEMGDDVGFFLFPPIEEGAPVAAMSAPLTFGIGAGAEHTDCAAYFLDWVATDETARQINVDVGGSNPGGPTDLAVPAAAEGSVTNETLAAGLVVAEADGAMDFIANATGAIFAQGWTPALQELVGGRIDAAGLLETVQAEYERELEAMG